uniref:WAP domain-containing protein n=1 Tax=Trichuris muris TaxID=70415 RepID=A0A5S6QXH3_TRIMR
MGPMGHMRPHSGHFPSHSMEYMPHHPPHGPPPPMHYGHGPHPPPPPIHHGPGHHPPPPVHVHVGGHHTMRTKPGRCKVINLISLYPQRCTTDMDCPGDYKCCLVLGEFRCDAPVR